MLGVIAVGIGTLIVGFNPDRFDVVLFDLPLREGHGVHAHDLVGLALVALGVLLLWTSPREA